MREWIVSQWGTQPISPELGDSGITEYRSMLMHRERREEGGREGGKGGREGGEEGGRGGRERENTHFYLLYR